jgi:hypothetical protein
MQPSPHPPDTVRRALVAIAVVLTVVAAALGSYYVLDRGNGNAVDIVDDGPTLYGALGSVNSSVIPWPGGPWTLSQVYGVASPIPADPSAWGWGEYDKTLDSCQAAFNGLTIWNGSIPLFDGTFNSGTAPFWQFVYFSNTTQQLLVATDVLGVTHVFPPIALTSECAEQSGLGVQPWTTTYYWGREGFPGNTPTMASDAWNVMAKSYVSWLDRPVGELYMFGATQFGSGQPSGDQVNFFTCGTPGAAGATPGLAIYGSTDEANFTGNSWNYTLGCTPTTNSWTAIPIELRFSNSSVVTLPGGSVVRQAFQFYYTGEPPYSGPGFNSRGVTSWMTALNLVDSDAQSLPIGQSDCLSWVPTLSDCGTNSTGWYAVILSPGGSWEGSFGETTTGPNWNYPVIPVANNETLAVVVPSSWNVSGDKLEVSSTTSELPLNGSATFP